MAYYRTSFSGRIFRAVQRYERFFKANLTGVNAVMELTNSRLSERLRCEYNQS